MKNMLSLAPIELNEKYRKKWNIHEHDFCHLLKNGEKISDTLYRVGGMGGDITKDYFLLLKHVESYYADNITKTKSEKPHLESQWCILDKEGIERVNFNQFDTPYLHGGVIYSLGNTFFNIETKEPYGEYSYSNVASESYLFLENRYDTNKSRRGVIKIKKSDGSSELIQ